MLAGCTSHVLIGSVMAMVAGAQTISDVWETTKGQQQLFVQVNDSNIQFVSGSGEGDGPTITVDELTTYQTIFGFGATLTDSSASTLNGLKGADNNAYNNLMRQLFDVSENGSSAGLNYIRVPIGASDFSAKSYTLEDSSNDTSMDSFSSNNVPTDVFSVLQDIKAINPSVLVHLCPWSPPAWMKDSKNINGGNFEDASVDALAKYLLKSVQAFQEKSVSIYAISIQNEPQSSNPTLPSAQDSTSAHAAVAVSLRSLLDSNGLNGVKIIGYEHNWDNAGSYATQLMQENGASDAFDGVAFHCYNGDVESQGTWHNAFPDKELYFTECTGTLGSDWWTDINWNMNNIFIGGLNHWAQSGLMWNLALDSQGGPKLPGATSCNDGCRGVVSIDGSSVKFNQEYYAIAHASKAIQPAAGGSDYGKRIGVNSSSDSLLVGAYSTKISPESRISLVVLNNGSGDVRTTISFQSKQAAFSFPVGLTTLSWRT